MAPMSIVVSGAPAMQPMTAMAPTMRPAVPSGEVAALRGR